MPDYPNFLHIMQFILHRAWYNLALKYLTSSISEHKVCSAIFRWMPFEYRYGLNTDTNHINGLGLPWKCRKHNGHLLLWEEGQLITEIWRRHRKWDRAMQLLSPLMKERLIQTVVHLVGQLNQGYLGHLCSKRKRPRTELIAHFIM